MKVDLSKDHSNISDDLLDGSQVSQVSNVNSGNKAISLEKSAENIEQNCLCSTKENSMEPMQNITPSFNVNSLESVNKVTTYEEKVTGSVSSGSTEYDYQLNSVNPYTGQDRSGLDDFADKFNSNVANKINDTLDNTLDNLGNSVISSLNRFTENINTTIHNFLSGE